MEPVAQDSGGQRKVSLHLEGRLQSKSHFMEVTMPVSQCGGLEDVPSRSPYREGQVALLLGQPAAVSPTGGPRPCPARAAHVQGLMKS